LTGQNAKNRTVRSKTGQPDLATLLALPHPALPLFTHTHRASGCSKPVSVNTTSDRR